MFQLCCFQMDGIQMTTAIVIFVFCLLNALKEVGQMIQQVSLTCSPRNTQDIKITKQSYCVTARGVPPAPPASKSFQIFCPNFGGPPRPGTGTREGGGAYLELGPPYLGLGGPPVNTQTENITFPILGMRAVKITLKFAFGCKTDILLINLRCYRYSSQ